MCISNWEECLIWLLPQSGGRKAFDTGITSAADIVITDGLDENLFVDESVLR